MFVSAIISSRNSSRSRLRAAVAALVLLAASLSPALAERVTVLTHSSFSLPSALVSDFTAQTGVEVVFLSAGDAGEVLNRAILTKARPVADVLFGVDDLLLERARAEGLFEPYESPLAATVDDAYDFSPEHLVTPTDVGWVIPNVDVAWFAEHGVELPATLAELADPAYAGLLVTPNPATSSPGFAFMLATIATFGDPSAGLAPAAGAAEHGFSDWLDFWAALEDNDVLVTDGWTDAYYTQFSRYGGVRPVVVSYLTSPAAELIFADESEGLTEPPTRNLECGGCAYRQVEAVGVLAGTKNRAAAEQFVDFMLSAPVQEAIPLEMFVHPVVTGTALPPEFEEFAQLDEAALASPIDAAVVGANQARWLVEWTAVVLQGLSPEAARR